MAYQQLYLILVECYWIYIYCFMIRYLNIPINQGQTLIHLKTFLQETWNFTK